MILANVGLRSTGALIPSGDLLKTPKVGARAPSAPPAPLGTSLRRSYLGAGFKEWSVDALFLDCADVSLNGEGKW